MQAFDMKGNYMKVNVLGIEYTILFDCDEEIMPEGADGCMDQSTKQIKIAKLEADRSTVQNIKAYRNQVLRHEIIHAFLYESGLWANSGSSEAWGQDETITDWIAIQFPKLMKAFIEAECLGIDMNIVDAGECIVPMNDKTMDYMKNFLDKHGRLKGGIIHLDGMH